jgi:hypothetical protein
MVILARFRQRSVRPQIVGADAWAFTLARVPAHSAEERRLRALALRFGSARRAAADGTASGADAPAGQPPRRPGRPGTLAAQTHAAVDDLVRVEGLTKAQAFERLGAESGRRPGIVSAAYYRAARNAARARGGPRGPGRRAGTRGRQGGGGGAIRALEAARDALQELVELVRRQEQELAQLRAGE